MSSSGHPVVVVPGGGDGPRLASAAVNAAAPDPDAVDRSERADNGGVPSDLGALPLRLAM